MARKLEIGFQVLETTVRVVYQDALKLDADVIVSTDDSYLSASSGIAKRIWDKANREARAAAPVAPTKREPRKIPRLRRELRKFSLPLRPGAVVVTSGGDLKAKYIFHAAALDLDSRPGAQMVIANIVHNVMTLASALGAESVVTPILVNEITQPDGTRALVSQLTGIPQTDIVNLTLRHLALFIATAHRPVAVREVTIALYNEDASTAREAEQQIFADLAALRGEVASWIAQCTPINEWMVHLLPLIDKIGRQSEQDYTLVDMLHTRLRYGQELLCQLFALQAIGAGASIDTEDGDGPANEEEYKRFRTRFETKLEEADADITSLERRYGILKRSKNTLEDQIALMQPTPSTALLNQLDQAEKELEQVRRELDEAEADRETCRRGLRNLERTWQHESDPTSLIQAPTLAPAQTAA
jgi:O-acetyl-ADP-ribose deacetylase (regulator of RNase III)